jgi:hypothetical protein
MIEADFRNSFVVGANERRQLTTGDGSGSGHIPDARVKYAIAAKFGYKYAFIEDACSVPFFASRCVAFS